MCYLLTGYDNFCTASFLRLRRVIESDYKRINEARAEVLALDVGPSGKRMRSPQSVGELPEVLPKEPRRVRWIPKILHDTGYTIP